MAQRYRPQLPPFPIVHYISTSSNKPPPPLTVSYLTDSSPFIAFISFLSHILALPLNLSLQSPCCFRSDRLEEQFVSPHTPIYLPRACSAQNGADPPGSQSSNRPPATSGVKSLCTSREFLDIGHSFPDSFSFMFIWRIQSGSLLTK